MSTLDEPSVLDAQERHRALAQLGIAYSLVRQLDCMDAPRVGEFVCSLLEAGEAEKLDAVLEHIDVAAGAWRKLADQADLVIAGVAAAMTSVVLERASRVEEGSA
ncbi:hypothetical protein VSR34_27685 [Paraburkholderia sp. JHI2823]|uniref:hypothetical protein n=1 Tax=Paraburkholderia sp. JHI2823 TaxID=3112960 RepID=UPI003178BD68